MYILKINTKAFVILSDKLEVTIDYTEATTFPTIGSAMRAAIQANDMLGSYLTKVVRI